MKNDCYNIRKTLNSILVQKFDDRKHKNGC